MRWNSGNNRWAILFTALITSACAEKPPDCAARETIGLASDIVRTELRDRFTPQFSKQPQETRQVLSRLLQEYLSGLKVGLVNIVSNGYSSDAKRFSCEGKLTVTSATGREVTLQTPYTTQKTQDQKHTFLLRIERFDALERDMSADFLAFVDADMAKRAASSPASSTTRAPQVAVAGQEVYRKDDASARISRTGGEVGFQLNSAMESFTCELEGSAKLESSNLATYAGADKDDPCTAKFEFSDGQLTVSTEGCSSACGMRAQGTMDGVYKRETGS